MKFSGKSHHPPVGITSKSLNPSPDSDLQPPKPFQRRRPKTPGTRLRRYGAPGGKRSRPETPLLKWKIHERNDNDRTTLEEEDQGSTPARFGRRTCRNAKKQTEVAVSARRLAAGLWRLHLPEMGMGDTRRRLGFKVKIKKPFFWIFFFCCFEIPYFLHSHVIVSVASCMCLLFLI